MTLRRLWVLVQGLPRDAAVWREESAWTNEQELLAGLIELTDIASRRVVLALGGRFQPDDKPIRIQRPNQPEAVTDPEQIAAWFSGNVN